MRGRPFLGHTVSFGGWGLAQVNNGRIYLWALCLLAQINISACGGSSSGGTVGAASSSASSSSSSPTGEFVIKSQASNTAPVSTPAGLSNGNFIVGWTETMANQGGFDDRVIRAQIFSPTGSPVTGVMSVGDRSGYLVQAVAFAPVESDRVSMAWFQRFNRPSSGIGTEALVTQEADATGVLTGSPVSTLVGGNFAPVLASISNGKTVVVWQAINGQTEDIKAQISSAGGAVSLGPFTVNSTNVDTQKEPAVAALANGGFVVAWQDNSAAWADTTGSAIKGQVFAADGSRVGNEILLNDRTQGDQRNPSVAPLAGGGFVVAWEDASATIGDTSGTAIRARLFTATGTAMGSEFQVNTTTDQDQSSPSVAVLNDGTFVIAWQDTGFTAGDTGGSSIKLQRFSSVGAPSGQETLVNAPSTTTKISPQITALSRGGFVVLWKSHSGALGTSGSTEFLTARVF